MIGPRNSRERLYSDEEICELIQKAKLMGLPIDTDREMAEMEIGELERLVSTIQ